jgi:Uma2 family endonuclease
MTLVGAARWISPEEYLAAEPQGDRRREYVNGHAFDIADQDVDHGRIIDALVAVLTPVAQRRDGRIDVGGAKLRVETANAFYYPDLLFTCEEPRADAVVYAPELVAEVAAANTLSVDLREKLAAYLTIPWLKEYVIVDINRRQADVWRRTPDGWRGETHDGAFDLQSLGVSLTIEQLFG